MPIVHEHQRPSAIPTTYRWTRNLEELTDAWTQCFGNNNALRSQALQAAAEAAKMPDVETHYLVGEDAEGAACLAPCFTFKVSLVTVAGARIQRVVARIRKVFPNFLQLRVFVVGSPISNCGDLLGLGTGDRATRWDSARLASLFKEITRRARSLNISLVLIKEPDTELTNRLRPALADRFFFAESLPTTCLTVPALAKGGYIGAICSRYRNKLKKRKSVGEQNHLAWEISPTCRGQEDAVFDLYRQVLENSAFVFERLNREFFPQVERLLGDRMFFLFGYRQMNGVRKLVACELVLIDHDTLHPLYSGFDYWVKKDSSLYFNAFYRIIEEAEKRGISQVDFGQTAYEVKAELGAVCVPLFVGVHHRNRVLHALLMSLRRLIFPPSFFPSREVFGNEPTPSKNGRPVKTASRQMPSSPLINK